MGIVWAGVYDSNDAHVVAPLVVGAFVLICFALYGTLANFNAYYTWNDMLITDV